jgi:hypothetical protein
MNSKICLLAVLVLTIGCSSDDTSSPTDTTPRDLIAVGEIDDTGGDVGDARINLNIPAGAFNETAEISFYTTDDDRLDPDAGVTPVYRLEGLPSAWYVPLRLAVKHDGSLEDESSLFISGDAFDPETNETITHYFPYAAVDSSGYLVTEIPASPWDAGKQRLADTGSVKVSGNSYYVRKKTEHFDLSWFKWDNAEVADSVGSFLEQAIPLVDALGFDSVDLLNGRGKVFVSSDTLDKSRGSVIEHKHLGFQRKLDISIFAGGDRGEGMSRVRSDPDLLPAGADAPHPPEFMDQERLDPPRHLDVGGNPGSGLGRLYPRRIRRPRT